jgi:hypothetical protein
MFSFYVLSILACIFGAMASVLISHLIYDLFGLITNAWIRRPIRLAVVIVAVPFIMLCTYSGRIIHAFTGQVKQIELAQIDGKPVYAKAWRYKELWQDEWTDWEL